MPLRLLLLLACSLACHPAWSQARSSFRILPDLPGGEVQSWGYAVTPDGQTVVGASRDKRATRAVLWRDGQTTELANISPYVGGFGHDVASDGETIVGNASGPVDDGAFRWVSGVYETIPHPQGRTSAAFAVSDDGRTIVGRSYVGGVSKPFRWKDGVLVELLDNGGARDVSADGTRVAGSTVIDGVYHGFLWEEGGTTTLLGDLPGGGSQTEAIGISADGRVVVGNALSAAGEEAFRWEAGTMVGLGDLPGGEYLSAASSTTADGSVVVGTSLVGTPFELAAFYWAEERGMRAL